MLNSFTDHCNGIKARFHHPHYRSGIIRKHRISAAQGSVMKIHMEDLQRQDGLDDFTSHVSICNTRYTVLWVNRKLREKLGVSKEELRNRTCYQLFKGNANPCADCPVNRLIEDGCPKFSIRLLNKALSPFAKGNSWFLRFSPIKNRIGRVVGVIIGMEEVVSLLEKEYEHEKRSAVLFNIAEASQDLIWASNNKGMFTYVNSAVERILGYASEEMVRRPVSQFMLPDDEGKDRLPREGIVNEQGWKNLPIKWLHKDGSIKILESSALPIFDINEHISGYRGLDRDITDRMQLMAQLTQSQKMASVGRLASGVLHDFNNMLSVILGYAEIAFRKVQTDQPVYEYLKQIQNAAQRSSSLTRQLLAFARKQVIKPELLDLNRALGNMLKLLQRLISSDIELIWILREGLWPIEMDPSQVDQILVNLCVNARDAIAGSGKITIRTRNQEVDQAYCQELMGLIPGEYVVFSISDTGKGIAKEVVSKIFEPFFTTKVEGQGTGLGLSTVYRIVKQNGGFIYAFSEPGEETRFDLYFPRAAVKLESDLSNSIDREMLTGSESILLVEDEKANLIMVKLFLEDLGYKVTAESNSRKALEIYQADPEAHQLLLTDMIMPDLRGRELRDEIRKTNPDLKYLFMSGYGTDSALGRIRILSDEPFLQKPFSQRALAVKVREVLESAWREASFPASAG